MEARSSCAAHSCWHRSTVRSRQPVDQSARLRLRGLWPLIGRFEGLIGSEALRLALAVYRAEDNSGRSCDSALS
jgi:hypothetical protein